LKSGSGYFFQDNNQKKLLAYQQVKPYNSGNRLLGGVPVKTITSEAGWKRAIAKLKANMPPPIDKDLEEDDMDGDVGVSKDDNSGNA